MATRDELVNNFVQKTGPRAGQRFRVKRGASGLKSRIYQGGDVATPKGQTPKFSTGFAGLEPTRQYKQARGKLWKKSSTGKWF
jgi:hypothetical protein